MLDHTFVTPHQHQHYYVFYIRDWTQMWSYGLDKTLAECHPGCETSIGEIRAPNDETAKAGRGGLSSLARATIRILKRTQKKKIRTRG